MSPMRPRPRLKPEHQPQRIIDAPCQSCPEGGAGFRSAAAQPNRPSHRTGAIACLSEVRWEKGGLGES